MRALYATMNQPYRVRIKTKVKVRIAIIIFCIASVLSIGLFCFFDLNLNVKKEYSAFGEHYLVKPVSTRRGNSRLQNTFTIGKFKLSSSKTIEHHIDKTTSHDGFYCIAEVLKDKKHLKYQIVNRNKCV